MGDLRSALEGMTTVAPRVLSRFAGRCYRTPVCDERVEGDDFDAWLNADAVVALAGQQDEAREVAKPIHERPTA
jgi:hypothetical protein